MTKRKILAGRKAVEAYRQAHTQLHSHGWYKGISKDHTLLLKTLVKTLEELDFTSGYTDFEKKKTEILKKFWEESDKYCLIEAKNDISRTNVYKDRQDIAMLGKPRKYNGVELKETTDDRELIIDNNVIMTTEVKSHFSEFTAAKECPNNSRVFIGGLGLGLILLYLKELKKVNEIIVCEIDGRVIHLLSKQITDYLDLPIQIIQGDALKEIKNYGKFDWVCSDFADNTSFGILAKEALTKNGVYTPCNSMAWRRWH